MVVIVIIGILAAIAIPNYIALKNRALEASVKSNMYSAVMAVEEFNTLANGVYPGDLDTRVSDVSLSLSNMSLASGVRVPPFPQDALLRPHPGFRNPFAVTDNVIDNLLVGPPPPMPPAVPRGCVYYSSYQTDGVSPGANGQPAYSYCITAYGASSPLTLVFP